MFDNISLLSLQLHLNGLVFDRNIFGSSSAIFGYLRKMFRNTQKMLENIHLAFRKILGKSSEIFGKWSEIFGKSSKTARLYNKKNMNFMFEWQELYPTSECSERVRYSSCHSHINFIFSRHRVISSIII